MKEQFEVIALENQTMTLKVNRSGGCHSCSASSGCGTGILANYFDHYSVFNKPIQFHQLNCSHVLLCFIFFQYWHCLLVATLGYA